MLISQNLFINEETNAISRMWGLIYNLNSNKIMLHYLKNNFFEVGRDTYLVINQSYQNINYKFTKELDFFLKKNIGY